MEYKNDVKVANAFLRCRKNASEVAENVDITIDTCHAT